MKTAEKANGKRAKCCCLVEEALTKSMMPKTPNAKPEKSNR
jgi:hypothetical protein